MALETGSETYAPLALSIIGGLIVSVVLTVYIVHAAYLLMYKSKVVKTSPQTVAVPSP
jgi:Cu/Ag efflux pump CusA